MNPEQITLVQNSFKHVEPISEIAAGLFYDRLFEITPSLRPMFKGDIKEQGRLLMQMLSIVVKGLNRLDTILPAIEDLGRRHVTYGVKEEHYDKVGAALLWTLDKGLGEAFTPEVEAAWTAAYGLLAGAMKAAAAEVKVLDT